MSEIPDFNDDELNVVKETVKERYGEAINIELADTELRLDPSARQLTTCPAVYWEARDCHFVICKLGEQRYHNQFFYRGYDQYGTGIREYDDIFTCVTTLLQIQADHEAKRNAEAE